MNNFHVLLEWKTLANHVDIGQNTIARSLDREGAAVPAFGRNSLCAIGYPELPEIFHG